LTSLGSAFFVLRAMRFSWNQGVREYFFAAGLVPDQTGGSPSCRAIQSALCGRYL